MIPLTNNIYYLDKDLFDKIQNDFVLIDEKDWYQLYQNKSDNFFWRLDQHDKLQEQLFVRLINIDNWESFDDKSLRIDLLAKTRGFSHKNCIWKNCNNKRLIGLVHCAIHSYEEMGMRK